ncbi:MAG: beta-N-acetylhexosaminidase [Actinobacteria bacterium HGW-Actinobacteria-4]|nr:MAG: beta-N-acetylhexosaminidase [Actinobacteria bacterium HGW-Actinobacteria-4]
MVPYPSEVTEASGELAVAGSINVVTADGAPSSAAAVNALVTALDLAQDADAAVALTLELDPSVDQGAEAYRLTIDSAVTVRAATDAGLFYGVQTLRQLFPAVASDAYALPRLVIRDSPEFGWRGSMIDVARTFLPLDYLKAHVERMALFKLNKLHLHLSDDQGWRLEIKSWPRLALVGGSTDVRGGPGGYYTQEDMRELVTFAALHQVEIIPEIDLPGHTQAALASYPELACDDVTNLGLYSGTEVGFSKLCLTKPDVIYPFVEDVLREVADIFPGRYLHIGGDEIKDPLYSEFIERADAIAARLGREIIAWEEASVANVRTTALLQLWNDGYDIQPALDRGNHLILSPCSFTYLDHGNYEAQPGVYSWCRAEGIPLERTYAFNPQSFTQAVGVEAPVWSELVEDEATADNRMWPRLAAVAEVAWSTEANRDYGRFTLRLGALRPHLDALGIQYFREPQLGW